MLLCDSLFLDFLERHIRFYLSDSCALAFSLCELGIIRTDRVTRSLFLIAKTHIPGLRLPLDLPVDFFFSPLRLAATVAEWTDADFALIIAALFRFPPELERDFPLILHRFVRQAPASQPFARQAQEIPGL
jgi:hypothetical protein